jgi:GNAT superfamily N-acetyltransferase
MEATTIPAVDDAVVLPPTPEDDGGDVEEDAGVSAAAESAATVAAVAAPPKKAALKIDISDPGLATSSSSALHVVADDRKSPSSTAQDNHPYSRGAVIEVWHIPKKSDATADDDEDWWSDESSDEEDDFDNGNPNQQGGGGRSIRLCDIIDRVPHKVGSATTWRYYVHYRDFNRRMDEWITTSRIVSPPSIGNAKARALKREEEKSRKRKLLEQQEAAASALLSRGVRRRSTAALTHQQSAGAGTVVVAGAAGANSMPFKPNAGNETPDGRRTRMSRRKSTIHDDDATLQSSNHDFDDDPLNTSMGSASSSFLPQGGGTSTAASMPGGINSNSNHATLQGPSAVTAAAATIEAKTKEVMLADAAAVTTTVVGEHTLATVKAVEFDEHEGMDEASLREHEEVTKIKNVGFLELGQYQMETWYFSPLPKELIHGNKEIITTPSGSGGGSGGGPHHHHHHHWSNNAATTGFLEVLYVCEFTLRMFARKRELQRFQRTIRPQDRHPPGNEIYRNGNLAMFEVDGLEEDVYCQNLCYIAKLFLDHKTLYYDVSPFLFYVLCEVDDRGFHPVGYYSKEKYSDVGYNLACILSFPAHQRKGYGRFLIAFSYELTKKEEKVGSPEKPMRCVDMHVDGS